MNSNTYLSDIEKFINEQYNKAEIWYNEFQNLSIDHKDVSIANTKTTFMIIGLNSIIELVHETIIKQYFVNLFDKIKRDNPQMVTYAEYEKERIINIIEKNDSSAYDSFVKLIESVQWRSFKKDFNTSLEARKSTDLDFPLWKKTKFWELMKEYNKLCEIILRLRNSKWHNPESYFTKTWDIEFNYDEALNYINLCKFVQKNLSEIFFEIGSSKFWF